MAIRTWGRALLVALGVSALAGAGQLGIAYGLGILRFNRSFTDVSGHWPAQLVWVAWFAVGATVTGAVLAERYARRDDRPVTAVVRVTLAVAATLGATVVAPLCMLPARNAQVASVDPVLAVAVSALFGALAGTVAAVAVLHYAPVAWNVAASTAAIWLLALLSVVPSLGAADPLPTVRLGALDPAWLAPDSAERLAMLLLPGLALLVGAAVAGVARRHGQPPLPGGASGVAAPLLVAVAYLLAGSGRGDDGYQSTPYVAALLAVLTGALGATAATMLRYPPLDVAGLLPRLSRDGHGLLPRLSRTRSRSGVITPTEILRPLPPGTGLPPVPSPAPPSDDPVPAPNDVPAADPTGDGSGAPGHPTSGTAGDDTARESFGTGPQPIGRLPWHVPRAAGADTSRSGTGDWPVLPGTAETVSTGSLDWSRPAPARPVDAAMRERAPADGTGPEPVPTGRELPGRWQRGSTSHDDAPAATGGTTATSPHPGPAADGDATADVTGPPAGAQDDVRTAGGLRRLRGLLRRERSRADAVDGDRTKGAGGRAREEALLPHDEEYVDWVAQLGQPMPDTTNASDPDERRTLRSTGRHQRD